jgi:hypothetical protein
MVLTLVGRARRRLFHNELFTQGANAAVAVLITLILLLLLGTQLLDWRWILLVSILGAGAALYRARKRLPSPYAAARMVDHRLALADTISTAVYFHKDPPARTSPAIRQFQLERAGRVSATVDVRRAVPYAMPRGAYPMAILVLVAGSLFALRYGLMGRLDLRPPLAQMLRQQFGWNEPTEVAKNMRRQPSRVPDPRDEAGASVDDPDRSPSSQPDASANGSDASSDSHAGKDGAAQGDARKDVSRDGKSEADGDQDAQAENNPSPAGENSGQEAGKRDQKQQSGGKPEANNSSENSSLMNKARDLLQNLLSSLKPPPGNPGSQQQNGDSNNQQGKGQPKQQNGRNGAPQDGQRGDQSAGSQGEQGQDQQDKNQQGSGNNDSQQAGKQPGSGAGNQDGDKRTKQAEDLAAMGKITEILGKRSTNLTGEATVEVQSTSQQLRTPYVQRGAQHGQSGGEINRDEVPAAMQSYVQQYFEQARKQATTTPPAKKP